MAVDEIKTGPTVPESPTETTSEAAEAGSDEITNISASVTDAVTQEDLKIVSIPPMHIKSNCDGNIVAGVNQAGYGPAELADQSIGDYTMRKMIFFDDIYVLVGDLDAIEPRHMGAINKMMEDQMEDGNIVCYKKDGRYFKKRLRRSARTVAETEIAAE